MREIKAGFFLLLATVAAALMVWTRLQADFDHPTIAQVLAAYDANPLWVVGHAAARMLFGGLLLMASRYLVGATAATDTRFRIGALAIGIGGIGMIVSGAILMVNIGTYDTAMFDAAQLDSYRAIAGSVGNTLLGVGLIAIAPTLWSSTRLMRPLGAAAPIVGVSMILIWLELPAVFHIASGGAFWVWAILTAVGLMLEQLTPRASSDTPQPTLDAPAADVRADTVAGHRIRA